MRGFKNFCISKYGYSAFFCTKNHYHMGIIFLYCSKKWLVAQIQEYTTFVTFRMFLMIVKYFKGHRISLVVTGMLQNTSGILQSILKSLETFWRLRKSCIPEFVPPTTFYYSIKKIPTCWLNDQHMLTNQKFMTQA